MFVKLWNECEIDLVLVLLMWNVLFLKFKTIRNSIITSCVSQIGFSPFTTKADFCKVSCTKCKLGITSNNDSNRLRPLSKKHVIFNSFLCQYFTKGWIIFPNRNGTDSSLTGQICKNKIFNFSNFPQKSKVEIYLCDSTHV